MKKKLRKIKGAIHIPLPMTLAQASKELKPHKTNISKCHQCVYWKGDHCGMYSVACVNSKSKTFFMAKEEK